MQAACSWAGHLHSEPCEEVALETRMGDALCVKVQGTSAPRGGPSTAGAPLKSAGLIRGQKEDGGVVAEERETV